MPEVYEVHLSNGDCFCLIAQGREQAAWIAAELSDMRYKAHVVNVRKKDEWE